MKATGGGRETDRDSTTQAAVYTLRRLKRDIELSCRGGLVAVIDTKHPPTTNTKNNLAHHEEATAASSSERTTHKHAPLKAGNTMFSMNPEASSSGPHRAYIMFSEKNGDPL